MDGNGRTVWHGLGVFDDFVFLSAFFVLGWERNNPDAKHAEHTPTPHASQLHLSLILVDIHPHTYLFITSPGLRAITVGSSGMGRESRCCSLFLERIRGFLQLSCAGGMMIFGHPYYMLLFVFFHCLRLFLAWIGIVSTYTSHIEHEKCLVRSSGFLAFLFVCLSTCFSSPYSWHVGVLLSLLRHSIHYLLEGYWPDYLVSVGRTVLFSLLEASC